MGCYIMQYEVNNSLLYSDTLLPDIFISEYLPSMNSDYVKIYTYMFFLCKHNKQLNTLELSKKLDIEYNKVKNGLNYLEENGLIKRELNSIKFLDLKEKEINKLYRPRTTSIPNDASENNERNKRRNTTINAINNKFFQGLMSPTWYTDIDNWFLRFKFDVDVMYALFQHCYDHNGLSKRYIEKVAESWYSKGIITSIELDSYYREYEKVREIKSKIVKKLKLGRRLTEYEEDFVDKWNGKYEFSFEIIELVLKRTTGKSSPNFNYINAVLTDWHEKGLKTKIEIEEHLKKISNKSYATKNGEENKVNKVEQVNNFKQREYEEDEFEQFYSNK